MNDLMNVNRNITPWVVVNGHRPIYTTSSSGGSLSSVTTVARDLRAALEDVFYTYEVCATCVPLPRSSCLGPLHAERMPAASMRQADVRDSECCFMECVHLAIVCIADDSCWTASSLTHSQCKQHRRRL